MRRANAGDRELLARWIAAFSAEAGTEPVEPHEWADRSLAADPALRGIYLWEDGGVVVSLAGYTGPTRHGMRLGPVYTPPELRGHGYASAVTAALTQMLLDGGRRFCSLFTDLANPTSNKIYQEIGYRPVVDVDIYAFAASTSEE
jgi:predicted GNAT family acetyltransferase